MDFDIAFMFTALKAALQFTPVTILLAVVPLVIGIIIGTFIAIARTFKLKYISDLFQIYVVIVKGIPLVLLLLIVYFGFIQGFDYFSTLLNSHIKAKDISLIYIALIAFSIHSTAIISEAIRGALSAIDRGQYEAAYSVGMTESETIRRIIIPQIIPSALPVLCSIFIGLIKGSSIAFLVSVTDLLNGALITATGNYRFLEAYVAAAIVYWIICITVERTSHIAFKRLRIES